MKMEIFYFSSTSLFASILASPSVSAITSRRIAKVFIFNILLLLIKMLRWSTRIDWKLLTEKQKEIVITKRNVCCLLDRHGTQNHHDKPIRGTLKTVRDKIVALRIFFRFTFIFHPHNQIGICQSTFLESTFFRLSALTICLVVLRICVFQLRHTERFSFGLRYNLQTNHFSFNFHLHSVSSTPQSLYLLAKRRWGRKKTF